jgi:hypothetical protein
VVYPRLATQTWDKTRGWQRVLRGRFRDEGQLS